MPKKFSLSTLFAILALLAPANACRRWSVNHRPIDEVVAAHRNDEVAVSMRDRRWVVLRNPLIQNDSIVGRSITGDLVRKDRTSLALQSVMAVETRRFDLIRTLALVAFAALLPAVWKFATVDEE